MTRIQIMPKQTHVIPTDNGWASKDTGNEKVSRVFSTKQEAIDWARNHSKIEGNELFIHNKDGKIANRDSHGNDPCPPRDKK